MASELYPLLGNLTTTLGLDMILSKAEQVAHALVMELRPFVGKEILMVVELWDP